MKNILVADDHASVRHSMRELIAQREDFQVCAEASNGIEAVEKAQSMLPDVVVLDLAMGGLNGVDAAEEIRARFPSVRVLSTSMYDAEPLIPRLQLIGASGFVSKNQLATDLLPAIDAILEGQTWFTTEQGFGATRESFILRCTNMLSRYKSKPVRKGGGERCELLTPGSMLMVFLGRGRFLIRFDRHFHFRALFQFHGFTCVIYQRVFNANLAIQVVGAFHGNLRLLRCAGMNGGNDFVHRSG
jgi:CheY-like chemotaxis protein